jgi:hypothetical protein
MLNGCLLDKKPYSINDLLDGGEETFRKLHVINKFAEGGWDSLNDLIKSDTLLFNALNEKVWNNNSSIFGPMVYFLCSVKVFYCLFFSTTVS